MSKKTLPPPQLVPVPETTLHEAKEWLRRQVNNGGAQCPCCTQFAKVYKRKLNSSMVRGLLTLYRYAKDNPSEEWLHLATIFRESKVCSSNDGALLRHWSLIEPFVGVRPDGSKRVGFHRLTDLGKQFALGRCTVPAYAVLYSERLLRLSTEHITIKDALSNKFNYSDLMDEESTEEEPSI